MQGLIEEYGSVLITMLIGSILLGVGFWLFTALAPMVSTYLSVVS